MIKGISKEMAEIMDGIYGVGKQVAEETAEERKEREEKETAEVIYRLQAMRSKPNC